MLPRTSIVVVLMILCALAGFRDPAFPSSIVAVSADDPEPGTITSIAGNGGAFTYSGDGGPATEAGLVLPNHVAVAPNGDVYINDSITHAIRKVSFADGVITRFAGDGTNGLSGDGGPALSAAIGTVWDIEVGPDGNLYFTDIHNCVIRKIELPSTTISTVFGTGSCWTSGGTVPSDQMTANSYHIDIDSLGRIYLSDRTQIRRIEGGVATHLDIDDGALLYEGFDFFSVAVDAAFNVYVINNAGCEIRKYDGDSTTVIVSGALAGDCGVSGDGGPAAEAMIGFPVDIDVSPGGIIYVTEECSVRRIQSGVISTVAGTYDDCGFGGDGGPATEATFGSVQGLNYTACDLYVVAQSNTNRVLRVEGIDQDCMACPPSGEDQDEDCLSDDIEVNVTGTNPLLADTDGDGLLDPWEVDPNVPGAGFHLASGVVNRDDVFGPFGPPVGPCIPGADNEGRVLASYNCFNHEPDPLHKDVYLEMDWQDCKVGDCPELPIKNPLFSGQIDPTHHAPNLDGLRDVIQMFREAPVSNPDGVDGVNLHVLIDERVKHNPNCDQGESAVRSVYFGTPIQRTDEAVMEAKTAAVRYVWSGHSSAEDGGCGTPGAVSLLLQGKSLQALPAYDYSPFGDADIGGRDILVTLGPLWLCSSKIEGVIDFGFLGPCYRETLVYPGALFSGPSVIIDPGIFPAKVPVPGEGNVDWSYPVQRLLGEREDDASRQLWSRSVAHLLGHSLGIGSDISVGNEPAPSGRQQSEHGSPLTPLAPETYSDWTGLLYAPPETGGSPNAEFPPNYSILALFDDPDNDGVPEHEDNCPGVYNPGQENLDQGSWLEQLFGGSINVLELGDACDPDIDGDGKPQPGMGEQLRSQGGFNFSLASLSVEEDQFPYDTNDDGEDNDVDDDDDGDGVLDGVDNCRLTPNSSQADLDLDGYGDDCDIDRDGDGFDNDLEALAGSNPEQASSTPEYIGVGSSCADTADNDGDTLVDSADAGCIDSDGDTRPDFDDNCPTVSNIGWLDLDSDGVGDACQLNAEISYSSAYLIGSDSGATVGWFANAVSDYSVRVGDCLSGLEVDAGEYDPGETIPSEVSFTSVVTEQLAEGLNTISVCVTTATEEATATIVIERDSIPPDTGIVAGPSEGSVSGSDVTFEMEATEPALFECSLDAGPFEPCESESLLEGLSAGAHTFETRASDAAGNVDATPASRGWTVGSSCTADLDYGDSVTGSISANGEIDEFTFCGTTGERVYVRMMEVAASSLIAKVEIHRQDDSLLCSNTAANTVPSSIAQVTCVLDQDGIYTVKAMSKNGSGTGSYAIHLQRMVDPENAVNLDFGTSTTGSLPTGFVHDFLIEGSAGDRIFVQAADTTNTSFSPRLEVYKPDGTLLCSANDNNVAEGDCQLPATGTYLVMLMSKSGPTGSYSIFIQNVSDPEAVTEISYGSNTNSALSAGEVETFGFNGDSGDHVYLRMGPHQSAIIHPKFVVYRPDGTVLCQGSAAGLGSRSHVDCVLDQTGEYTVIAYELIGANTGQYSMFVQNIDSPVGATSATYGVPITTSMTHAAVDTFTFDASANDSLSVKFTEIVWNTINPHLRVYRPDGTLLCQGSSNAAILEIDCTANLTGTYIVLVSDVTRGGEGDYELLIDAE